MTAVVDSPTRTLPWARILVASLVVALADAAFALVAYVVIDGRYNFETLLQYIASGVCGAKAFDSGWPGVWYGVLGFTLHGVLAFAFVLAYALAVPRLPAWAASPGAAIAYGAGIWVFMNSVVLPLGRSTQEDFFNGWYVAFLFDHAFFVGLPMALILGSSRIELSR